MCGWPQTHNTSNWCKHFPESLPLPLPTAPLQIFDFPIFNITSGQPVLHMECFKGINSPQGSTDEAITSTVIISTAIVNWPPPGSAHEAITSTVDHLNSDHVNSNCLNSNHLNSDHLNSDHLNSDHQLTPPRISTWGNHLNSDCLNSDCLNSNHLNSDHWLTPPRSAHEAITSTVIA